MQTVYLKILQGRARYDGRAAVKTWLFSVIRNTAAEQRRRRMVRKLRLTTFQAVTAGDEISVSFDEADGKSEYESEFRQLLKALPNRQREVLHLVFYQDLTVERAAEIMGITLGSARTHYHRGKQRIRKLLQTSGVLNE